MTRQTSAEAYNKIKDNGLLSKRRWQVYDIIYSHGPMTANQVISIFRKKHEMLNTGAVTTRMSELRDLGVLIELGETIDPITYNKVILWDVTKNLPQKLKNKKSRKKCLLCKGTGYLEDESPE